MRSGFRLLKKRKRSELDVFPARAPHSGVKLDGLHLSPGNWVVMHLPGQQQASLSQIKAITWSETDCYLHIHSYPPSYTHSITTTGPDGISFTPAANLQTGYEEVVIPLPSAAGITRILASHLGDTVYWVIQP